MKNNTSPNKISGKKPGKKKNVIVRFLDWIATGTQKASQQGHGPCKS